MGAIIAVLWAPLIIAIGAIVLNGILDCGINPDMGSNGSCAIGGAFLADVLSYVLMGTFVFSLLIMSNPMIGFVIPGLILVTILYFLLLFIKKYRETDDDYRGKKYTFLGLVIFFTFFLSAFILLIFSGFMSSYKYYSDIRNEQEELTGELVEKIENFSQSGIAQDDYFDINFAKTGLHFMIPAGWSIDHSRGYVYIEFQDNEATYYYEHDQDLKEMFGEEGVETDKPIQVSVEILTIDELRERKDRYNEWLNHFSDSEKEKIERDREKVGDAREEYTINGRDALYTTDASLGVVKLEITEKREDSAIVFVFETDSRYFLKDPELKDVFVRVVNQFYFDENFDIERLIEQVDQSENVRKPSAKKKEYVVPEKYHKKLQEIKCSFESNNPRDNVLFAEKSINNGDFVSAKQHFQWANDKNIKHKKMMSAIYQDMIGLYKNDSEELMQFFNENRDDPVLELNDKLRGLEFTFYKIASGEKEISDITDREWVDMMEDLTQTTILSVISCE